MTQALVQRLQAELDALWLVDPHTHINPHSAPSQTLADILGYHYYTELAHSAGIPRERIEEPGLSPREKVGRIVPGLAAIENTVQYSWLLEICRDFFGFQDERITASNWERLYDQSQAVLAAPGWEREVLQRSRLSGVFLTNDFDDPLTGFDTAFYIPCLRTDDLVFRLWQPETRERFHKATGQDAWDVASLRRGVAGLFHHFLTHRIHARPGGRRDGRAAAGCGSPWASTLHSRTGSPVAICLLVPGAGVRPGPTAVRPHDWCQSPGLSSRSVPGAGPV
jgi:glucuronate isomerase